ncbi:hypothetical protein, partial [Nonomuraea sp. NPDC005692]|uniref:hypothetical protein n=1 Tax=Nonomuraea sp. NPDC005692 TaxID=3157168 RepID=UPI0033F97DD1
MRPDALVFSVSTGSVGVTVRRARKSAKLLGQSGLWLGRGAPSKWVSRLALAATMALLPGILTLEAQAAVVAPSPTRLDIPGSPSSGNAGKVPVQRAGSAANLPHLVDPAATQPQSKGRTADDVKRPKGSLPVEKPRELPDKPATDGLNSPPPLKWEPSPAGTPSQPATNDGRPSRGSAEGAGVGKASPTALDGRQGSGAKAAETAVPRARTVSAVAAAALPVVSDLSVSAGQLSSGLWTLSSAAPYFAASGADPESRSLKLEAQVEHDPSVPAQGAGLIWSDSGQVSSSSCSTWSKCSLQTPTVAAGKLQDGWLVRWRVRASTSSGVVGAWTQWQAARVDLTKPVLSDLSVSAGQLSSGLWTLSSTTPYFAASGADPESRSLKLDAEVEHDPSVPAQGSGLIWSDSGQVSSGSCSTWSKCSLQTPTVTSGKLKDGWLVRWRVRASTSGQVSSPWSEWQAARIDISKPVVSDLSVSAGQLSSGLWTLSSTTPYFAASGADPESRSLKLEAQVEHDPSVPAQGAGLIWSDSGQVSSGSCSSTSKCSLQTPTVTAAKLKDGWLVRWRVRASTSSGAAGPWSAWQSATVQVSGTAGSGLGAVPATRGTDAWTLASVTPWLFGKVSDAGGARLVLGAEVEHDP